jgi:hypothetical protein
MTVHYANGRFAPIAVVRGPADADLPTRKFRQMMPRVGVHTLRPRCRLPAGSHHTQQASWRGRLPEQAHSPRRLAQPCFAYLRLPPDRQSMEAHRCRRRSPARHVDRDKDGDAQITRSGALLISRPFNEGSSPAGRSPPRLPNVPMAAGVAPRIMGVGPAPSAQKLHATIAQLDVIELNIGVSGGLAHARTNALLDDRCAFRGEPRCQTPGNETTSTCLHQGKPQRRRDHGEGHP